MRDNWDSLRLLNVEAGTIDGLSVKSPLEIKVEIYLDGISADDVDVQIYYGRVSSAGVIMDGNFISMKLERVSDSKKFIYKGKIKQWESGLNGYTIRIIPKHPAMQHPFEDGLIHWFED